LSTPFAPARDALLPDLAEGGSLTRWNALVQTSAQLAQVLGLLVGAWVLAEGGRGGEAHEASAAERSRVLALLAWDGLSFLLSAALLLAMRLPAVALGPRVGRGFGQTLREGLAYAWGDRVVRGLLGLTALDNLAIMGPAIVGATLLVQRTFGLPASALAGFEAAMAVGMLVGALLLAALGSRIRLVPLLMGAMALDGLTYLPFAWIERFDLGLVAIACHGVCIPAVVVGRTSLLHRHVPAERRGQVFALVGMTVAGMTALSALASGWIAQATSPRVLFLLAGVLGTLCGVVGAVWLGPRLARVQTP
jgi:MFS family permease